MNENAKTIRTLAILLFTGGFLAMLVYGILAGIYDGYLLENLDSFIMSVLVALSGVVTTVITFLFKKETDKSLEA